MTEFGCKLLQPLQLARSEAQRRQIKRYHFASIGQGTYAKNFIDSSSPLQAPSG
jgi:hypothetical protein